VLLILANLGRSDPKPGAAVKRGLRWSECCRKQEQPNIVCKTAIGRATVPSDCGLPCICVKHVNRLFSRREAQGASTEVVEMGDLSRREIKPDSAVVGLF
jgi:hypothetical protein